MYYAEDFIKKLQNAEEIVIYGARIVAKEVATCLMEQPYNFKISAFMVTGLEGNPDNIYGIPVIDVDMGKERYKDALIIVAVLERYQEEITALLKKEEFEQIVYLTFESDLWSEVRGNYFKYRRETENKSYLTLEEELEKVELTDTSSSSDDVHIYTAKCHVDRNLCTDMSAFDWEIPIQVGAALTEQKIADISDDTGNNISRKNKKYCELTALYWIWKNDKSKYAGMCHYRRHFNLDQNLLKKLANSDIDVIVTIPILNFPSVQAMYANDHCMEDWNIMLQAIKELQPNYEATAYKVGNGIYYYAYNMFVARKEILDAYCEWLFPILEYCEMHCKEKENIYQNRYIGFLAERLLTIYFVHNEQSLKMVHAKKTFITK